MKQSSDVLTSNCCTTCLPLIIFFLLSLSRFNSEQKSESAFYLSITHSVFFVDLIAVWFFMLCFGAHRLHHGAFG